MKKKSDAQEDTAVLRTIYDKLPIEVESANIAKFLPDELYKSVARIIGLDENIKEKLALAKRKDFKKLYKGVRYLSRAIHATTIEKETSEDYESNSYVEPPSPRVSSRTAINPYYDFLQKTERDQVRWPSKYLPPETEKEKGLVKRADELTNQICADFSKYMNDLGGYDSPIFQKETIKKLFEIEFNTHVAKSMLIGPKQLASLPKEFADHYHLPKLSRNNMLKRNIQWDIENEKKTPNLSAFNRQLPKDMQWRPPNNDTKKYWKPKDYPKRIVTMENVWDGITNLKSVQDYCKWIDRHPRSKRPNYLLKRDMFDMQKLEKQIHQAQYDTVNQLPKINVKELLARDKDAKRSPLPEDLKIVNE